VTTAPIEKLWLLDERATPGEAAWNMAVDEALLTLKTGAVLRLYRWERPAFSFGYFIPWREAASAAGPERELVRRWTGGGMVAHGDDFTWSLILPSSEPLSRQRPVESYISLHGVLARALQEAGIPVEQAGSAAPVPAGGLCFRAPAPGDLLVEGRKIAGAGQRRGRHGLLHQGSVCGVALPEDFSERLAAALGSKVSPFPREELPVEAVNGLVQSRYGAESWLRRR
jgi:lipoate-protein ligase A